MRLLKYDDDGEINLTRDLLGNDEIPRYAILSHTWGSEEVTFNDLTNGTGKDKAGHDKIRFCMREAARDGIHYSWVDTVCINKTDTTELQHAINSMFRWYRDAATCYVFLSDISTAKRKADSDSFEASWESAFRCSRWFTRGWTLQELLAPRNVKFFSREGNLLGNTQELTTLIHGVTRLPIAVLKGAPLDNFGVEERLGWTRERTTTREEDKAYSLLGVFGIFMPLIYGEGQANAFRRLRKEIHERRYASQGNSSSLRQFKHVWLTQLAFLDLSARDFDCLQSLSYPEQEHRHHHIHTATETCEWLLKDTGYNSWMNSPCGLFWIKGNPGSGKSVLMKHAVKGMVAQQQEGLVLSFFVHGQGSELQRTPTGVYRALLNVLLGHFPIYLAKLTAIFEDREKRFGGYAVGRWLWGCKELQDSLTDVLEHAQSQQITIFVDALDECGEEPARDLLAYFSALSRRTTNLKAKVRVCVSSRHYPILGLDDVPAIAVEERNHKDIQWYVSERLRGIHPLKRRQQIQEDILSKAQGGFQWVFLVTGTLMDRALSGRSLFGHVEACPETLGEIYATLLDTGSDDDRRQSIKLFHWVLYAKRPLSAQELREALAVDAAVTFTSVAELRMHGDWSETLEDFERYVNYISKGLIAFRSREIWEQWEDSDREAQLIHQSVADFLLQRFAMDPKHGTTGAGHFQISRSCLRYLTLQEVLDEHHLSRDDLSSRYPLAPYAVRYIFDHIKATEDAGLDQSDLISMVNWSSRSETVRQLDDLWRTLNPYNIGTPVGWPFIGSPDIHILAALGLKSQLLTVLKNEQTVSDEQDLDGNSILHVALLAGQSDVALSILKEKSFAERGSSSRNTARAVGLNARNFDGDTPIDVAVAMNDYSMVAELIAAGTDLRRIGQPHLLVRHAISSDDVMLLAKLIKGDINLAGAVCFAVEHDSSDIIIPQLLEAGSNFENLKISEDSSDTLDKSIDYVFKRDIAGGNALHLACRDGLSRKVDLLLKHGASAIALDNHQRCPLHIAVLVAIDRPTTECHHIVESLVRHSPTAVEVQDSQGHTPISIACDNNDRDLLLIFLEHGQLSASSHSLTALCLVMFRSPGFSYRNGLHELDQAAKLLSSLEKVDLNTKDNMGRNVFWLAAANGQELIVKRLIKVGAVDVNIRDSNLGSPLLAAVQGGHGSTVKVLLTAKGLDVNIRDQRGVFPLLVASEAGNLTIVKALLGREDIKVNARSPLGRSPLLVAVEHRHDSVVETLLAATHIDVNTRDDLGNSPLLAASKSGNLRITNALLDVKNINVNATNIAGQSPLLAAVAHGRILLVETLLAATHIDVNTRDDRGSSPLLAASKRGNLRIVNALLDIKNIDVNTTDIAGESPLLAAINLGHTSMVKALLTAKRLDVNARDSHGFSPLLAAVRSGSLTILDALLGREDINIKARDKFGNSLLSNAIHAKHIAGISILLLQDSIDVNAGEEWWVTPLWQAAEQVDKTIFEMLLQTQSIDLEAKDSQGRTLLSWSAEHGKETVVSALLRTGRVALQRPDNAGRTPLQKAKINGHTSVIAMLTSALVQ